MGKVQFEPPPDGSKRRVRTDAMAGWPTPWTSHAMKELKAPRRRRPRVPGAPFGVVWNVDVRRENVYRRPSGPPRIQHLRQRPAARIAARHILAGLVLSLAQPGVHVHRQRIFGFTGRRDMANVAAVVPRHE